MSAQRRTSMWELRQILLRFWRRCQGNLEARRKDRARARFWAEVREGEREAEARSGS